MQCSELISWCKLTGVYQRDLQGNISGLDVSRIYKSDINDRGTYAVCVHMPLLSTFTTANRMRGVVKPNDKEYILATILRVTLKSQKQHLIAAKQHT